MHNLVTTKLSFEDLLRRELLQDPYLKSVYTRRAYFGDLTAFENWRAGRYLTKLLVEEYLAVQQSRGKSPNTINRALASIRWWAGRISDSAREDTRLDQAQITQVVTHMEGICRVRGAKGKRVTKGRYIPDGELKVIIKICGDDPSPAGRRDKALIAIAWSTGLRREELSRLFVSDIRDNGDLSCELLVRGKGDRERMAYLFGDSYHFLIDWLKVRTDKRGPIFCAIRKSGFIAVCNSLGDESMRQLLSKRVRQAGISHITWHDFRRTFISNMLNLTDLATVQQLAGHSDPSTTVLYDRRDEGTRREAVSKLTWK